MPGYDPNYDPVLERRREDARSRQADRSARGDMPWPLGRGDVLGRDDSPKFHQGRDIELPTSLGDMEEKRATYKTPGQTIVASEEIYKPNPDFRMRGVSDTLPTHNPGEQRSGSEGSGKTEQATEKFSDVRRSTPDYGSLRENAQFGRPINIDSGSMSLADLEGDQRTRDILRERHRGRLEDISLDEQMRPDPMRETLKAQAGNRQYERGLPANIEDMNRLGASGLTRGEAMNEDVFRGRQDQQMGLQREKLLNAQEVARLNHPQNPSAGVPLQRQQALQELQRKYYERLNLIDKAQALPPGHPHFLDSQAAAEEMRLAKEEYGMHSNQMSGKSIYTPAPGGGI